MNRENAIDLLNLFLKYADNSKKMDELLTESIIGIDSNFFEVIEEAIVECNMLGDTVTSEFLFGLAETCSAIKKEVDYQLTGNNNNLLEQGLGILTEKGIVAFESYLAIHSTKICPLFFFDIQAKAVHTAKDLGDVEAGLFLIEAAYKCIPYLKSEEKEVWHAFNCVFTADIFQSLNRNKEALAELQTAEHIFKQYGKHYEYAEVLAQKANIFFEMQDHKYSLQLLKKSSRQFRSLRKIQPVSNNAFVQNYNQIGNIYREQGDLKKAEKHFQIAQRLIDKYNTDPDVIISFSNNHGLFKINTGEYSEALYLLYYVYTAGIKLEFYDSAFSGIFNIADIFLLLGNFPKAKKAIIKALQLNEHLKNPIALARCYQLCGLIEFNIAKKEQKSFRKALFYLNRAKKILEDAEEKTLTGEVYFNIGSICSLLNPERAHHYYEKAKPLLISYHYLSHFIAKKASVYIEKNDIITAIKLLQEASDNLPPQALKEKAEFYTDLALAHIQQGTLNKAMEYYLSALAIHDEVGFSLLDHQKTYFGDKSDVYEDSINVALAIKNHPLAFELLERAKAKHFKNTLQFAVSGHLLEHEILNLEQEEDPEIIFNLRKEMQSKAFEHSVEIHSTVNWKRLQNSL